MKTPIKSLIFKEAIVIIVTLAVYFTAFYLLGGWNSEGKTFYEIAVYSSVLAVFTAFALSLSRIADLAAASAFMICTIALVFTALESSFTSNSTHAIVGDIFIILILAILIIFTSFFAVKRAITKIQEKSKASERFIIFSLLGEFIIILGAMLSILFFKH